MTTLCSLNPKHTTTRDSTIPKWKKVPPTSTVDFAPWPEWGNCFEKAFGQAVEKYLAGKRGAEALFTPEHATFLASIGSTLQELYDFVEDWCELGEPSFGTALRMTEVRAEFFLLEQHGRRSSKVITSDSMPSREAKLGGMVWLPRIIAKARAKLQGEMPADLMFGCQRDRAFLKSVGIEPAKFLRVVWSAGHNDEEIVEYVKISAQFKKA